MYLPRHHGRLSVCDVRGADHFLRNNDIDAATRGVDGQQRFPYQRKRKKKTKKKERGGGGGERERERERERGRTREGTTRSQSTRRRKMDNVANTNTQNSKPAARPTRTATRPHHESIRSKKVEEGAHARVRPYCRSHRAQPPQGRWRVHRSLL